MPKYNTWQDAWLYVKAILFNKNLLKLKVHLRTDRDYAKGINLQSKIILRTNKLNPWCSSPLCLIWLSVCFDSSTNDEDAIHPIKRRKYVLYINFVKI